MKEIRFATLTINQLPQSVKKRLLTALSHKDDDFAKIYYIFNYEVIAWTIDLPVQIRLKKF